MYGCPVWSLTSKQNIDIIYKLQKKCIRIINFATYYSHTNPLFIEDKILKLPDIIKISQIKLIFDYKNNLLPQDLLTLFKLTGDVHTHQTRMLTGEKLFIPEINTTKYGNHSLRYRAPVTWNNFITFQPELNSIKIISHLKRYLKTFFITQYKRNIDI